MPEISAGARQCLGLKPNQQQWDGCGEQLRFHTVQCPLRRNSFRLATKGPARGVASVSIGPCPQHCDPD